MGLAEVAELPPKQRAAIVLRFALDLRYREVGEVFGVDFRGLGEAEGRRRLCAQLAGYRESLGIAGGLRQRGLTEAELPVLAAKAINDPCNATNPRRPTAADLQAVLGEAL